MLRSTEGSTLRQQFSTDWSIHSKQSRSESRQFLRELILKFIRKYKGPRIAERDNFDKRKVGGLTLYDFKIYGILEEENYEDS